MSIPAPAFPHPVTIRGRLLLVAGGAVCLLFLALGAVAVLGLPGEWLPGEWRQREVEAMVRLSTVADDKKTELARWFEERLGDARLAANNRRLAEYLASQAAAGALLSPAARNSLEIRRQTALGWLYTFLNAYNNYDGIEVVSTTDGSILLSTDISSSGTRFRFWEKLPANDSLPGEITIFFGADDADHTAHLYLAALVQDKPEDRPPATALVFRVDTAVVLERLSTGSSLIGGTGEIIMVDMNGVILNALRHPLTDGKIATPLVDLLKSEAAEYAAWGIDGTLQTTDYRGVPVLAAVRHIRILKDFGIGFILKQDRREVFAPIRRSLLTLGGIALAGLVLTLIVLSLVARNCLRPLERVTAAARRLGGGDLSARAPAAGADEAGVLAAAFNTMAEKIQRWNRDLEERIDARTRELAAANQQLRDSETRLQAIFDNSQDAISVSQNGVHVFANPAYLQLFGFEHPKDLAGRSILDLIAPESRDEVARHVEARKKALPAPAAYETRGLRRNGETFDMDVHATQYALGTERFTLAILRDITDRKKMEEDRKTLQDQLLHLQKLEAIGTLAGGIAHDFNNILAAILGYAELAEQDCPPGSQTRHSIEQIEKAGFRARDLVKQLLTFSRQQDKKAMEPVAPPVFIKETLKFLRATIPTTIEIRQEIAADCGAVLADPIQLHQALTNLCVNAAHAMEDKGGVLEVTVRNVEVNVQEAALHPGTTAGAFVCISVSDTGRGVPPAILNRIFDPYFTTKEVGKGSGMGLAIVHGIVLNLGGFIRVENRPGEGADFHVFLPRVAQPTTPAAEQKDLPEERYSGNEHVLIVDDEQLIVEMEKFHLERLGYRVTTADDGAKALSVFHAAPDSIDLVVTDQTMPGHTGLELSRRLLALRPGLPIILCTGFSSRVDEETAKAAGIRAFAMKPLPRGELARLVREVLDMGMGSER